MAMDLCCMPMEIFIGGSGLMARNKAGDCRFIRKWACSMRDNGKMINLMAAVSSFYKILRTTSAILNMG